MICTLYDLNTKNEQHNNGAAYRVHISFFALPFRYWFGRKIPLPKMVSRVYLSCLNMPVVCYSSKKQIIEMLFEL